MAASLSDLGTVVIAVGGFLPGSSTPSFADYFPLPSHLPTLHVIGRNDTLVTEERGRTLVEKCENARVEFHDGGELVIFLRLFLLSGSLTPPICVLALTMSQCLYPGLG